jgi:hypothetical protein
MIIEHESESFTLSTLLDQSVSDRRFAGSKQIDTAIRIQNQETLLTTIDRSQG